MWFIAPQFIMTAQMKESVDKLGLTSVLGDVYCDDWKFAEDVDKFLKEQHERSTSSTSTSTSQVALTGDATCRTVMEDIGKLLLSQAQPGSIAILHMPEKGFREGLIYTLEEFLRGAQERGWECCSLTDAHSRIELAKEKRNTSS